MTARKKHEEALALRKAMDEKLFAAESQSVLAMISIEEGNPSGAERLAWESLAVFHEAKSFDSEAPAQAVLALALSSQGKMKNAEMEIENAKGISQKSEAASQRIVVAITAARIKAGSDRPSEWADAQRSLNRLLMQAVKLGYTAQQLEIRFILGEIDVKTGKTAEGRARLIALEKAARAKGFDLIARKASAAIPREGRQKTL